MNFFSKVSSPNISHGCVIESKQEYFYVQKIQETKLYCVPYPLSDVSLPEAIPIEVSSATVISRPAELCPQYSIVSIEHPLTAIIRPAFVRVSQKSQIIVVFFEDNDFQEYKCSWPVQT